MEFYLTLGIFGFMMLAMSVGVIFSGRRLKGSCGGVGGECPCEDAGTPNACKVDLSEASPLPDELEDYQQNDGVIVYRSHLS